MDVDNLIDLSTMKSILASTVALSLLVFGAATDCSQSGTKLDLCVMLLLLLASADLLGRPQGVTWLCQEHFQWHLSAEAVSGATINTNHPPITAGLACLVLALCPSFRPSLLLSLNKC